MLPICCMVYIWCSGACTNHSFMQVYFMNNLPNENWRYENEPITKDKILEWANEWSTFPTPDLPDGNPVPKFVRVDEKTDSGIRVKFTGTQNIFVSLNDLEMSQALLQVTKNYCKMRGLNRSLRALKYVTPHST